MEATGISGARRHEDIALDLMKFVATTAHVTKPASGPTGFGVGGQAKAGEDQVDQLLDLYKRCLTAVNGK